MYDGLLKNLIKMGHFIYGPSLMKPIVFSLVLRFALVNRDDNINSCEVKILKIESCSVEVGSFLFPWSLELSCMSLSLLIYQFLVMLNHC